MAVIHRLLCTHCTFGTSELETHSADNAAKVLGYSVRKSSLPDSERGQLRQVFRAVERLLSYSLPRDATAAQKETLSADLAPRRLIFMPNLGGWQVAGQVAYRAHDTAGRPGSYFADLLVSKAPDPRNRAAAAPWSAKDVLQLWSVGHDRKPSAKPDWWVSSEEQLTLLEAEENARNPESEACWKPAAPERIDGIRDSRPALLDDATVFRFLTAQTGDDGTSTDPIIPPRWWAVPAAVRQELVAAVLHATLLGPARGGRETVTLAVEPSVAAVVFYAVCRLLPGRVSGSLSFSTYEPAPDRPLTGLVATTCLDEAADSADLPSDLTHRAFACDTFRDPTQFGRGQAPSEHSYARHVVGLAVASHWQSLDCFLTTLDLDGVTAGDLDRLLDIERRVKAYLNGSGPGGDPRRSPLETQFLKGRFQAGIEARLTTQEQWPDDLLRVALAWFGDDFEQLWRESQSIRNLLARYLPRDTKRLARMLASSGKGPRVPMCVRAAAVIAAMKDDPQHLPDAFIDYCKDACHSAARPEATMLVRAVMSEVRDPTALQSTRCFELTDLILEGIRETPDLLQHLPIADLLTASLVDQNESLESKADLLAQHHALAKRILPSDGRLEHILSQVFADLLDVQTKDPGRHLVKGGRSRVRQLKDWLPPRHHGQEALDTWLKLHAAIERLAADAPQWRIWPKPKNPDATHTQPIVDLIDRLSPLEPSHGERSLQRQQHLATGVIAALVSDEKNVETVRAWLTTALGQNVRHFGPGRGHSRRRKPLWAWAAAGCLAMVVVGTIGLLAVGSREEPSPATGTDARPDEQIARSDSREKPPLAASSTQEKPPPAPSAPPAPQPLTKSDIGLAVKPEKGDLRVTWNTDALKKGDATITSLLWRGPGNSEGSLDHDNPLIQTHEQGFGDYTVTLTVSQQLEHTVVCTTKQPIPQPEIKFTMPRIELNDDGKAVLRLRSDRLLPQDLYGHGVTYTLDSTVSEEKVQGDLANADLLFPLPADVSPEHVKPPAGASLRQAEFSVIVQTQQGKLPPIQIEPPGVPDVLQEIRNSLAQMDHVASSFPGKIPEQKGSFDLCTLPWNIDEESFDIALATPALKGDAVVKLERNSTNGRKDWHCVYREKGNNIPISSFFRLERSKDRWGATLRYVFSGQGPVADEARRGLDALRLCRLCLFLEGKVCGTLQLLEPRKLGSLDFKCPVPSVRQSARLCDDSWNKLLAEDQLSGVAITSPLRNAKDGDGLGVEGDSLNGALHITVSADEGAAGLKARADMKMMTDRLVIEPFHWGGPGGKRLGDGAGDKAKSDLQDKLDSRQVALSEVSDKIAEWESVRQKQGELVPAQKKELQSLQNKRSVINGKIREFQASLKQAEQEEAFLSSVRDRGFRIPQWTVVVEVQPPINHAGNAFKPDDLQVKIAFGGKDGEDVIFGPAVEANDRPSSPVNGASVSEDVPGKSPK